MFVYVYKEMVDCANANSNNKRGIKLSDTLTHKNIHTELPLVGNSIFNQQAGRGCALQQQQQQHKVGKQ